jgi:hypothetical protein
MNFRHRICQRLELQGTKKNNLKKHWAALRNFLRTVVSKQFIVDVALGRVRVATEGRTSQLEGSDGMLRDPEPFLD